MQMIEDKDTELSHLKNKYQNKKVHSASCQTNESSFEELNRLR